MNDYKNSKTLLPGQVLLDRDPDTGELTNKFLSSDTRELFKANRKKHGKDFFRGVDISYNLNSNGYRAPEWDQVDWKNSAVIMGCSNVFGIGLPEEETISYKLEKLLKLPVINLGVPATGIAFSLHNSLKLFQNFEIPKIVINVWSSPDRIHLYTENHVLHCGGWSSIGKKDFFYHWSMVSRLNSEMHSYFNIIATREFWKSKTNFYEYSFFDTAARSAECQHFTHEDYARDLLHPGPKTTSYVSNFMYNDIIRNEQHGP